jgi:hypothetical protein
MMTMQPKNQYSNADAVQMTQDLAATSAVQVGREVEQDSLDTLRNYAQRMSNPNLSALRAQNPFLPIVPFPNSVINVLLVAAGPPVDIYLPEGTKYINIRATSEYFASRNGNAQIPTTTVNNDGQACSFDSSQYIYVEELRSFSVISTGANNALCVSCYQQL